MYVSRTNQVAKNRMLYTLPYNLHFWTSYSPSMTLFFFENQRSGGYRWVSFSLLLYCYLFLLPLFVCLFFWSFKIVTNHSTTDKHYRSTVFFNSTKLCETHSLTVRKFCLQSYKKTRFSLFHFSSFIINGPIFVFPNLDPIICSK